MFWAPCGSGDGGGGWRWVVGESGWVDGGGGWLGGAPHMCTHTHMHAHTCMCGKHDNFMQMAAPLGESLGIPYDVICACACVHICVCTCMCMCVGCTHSPPPTPIHPPPPPRGNPQNQSKFNSTWTNQDISIPFEDLKSVETSPSMGGCMVWWVGGWV